jgi:hypothetical protein
LYTQKSAVVLSTLARVGWPNEPENYTLCGLSRWMRVRLFVRQTRWSSQQHVSDMPSRRGVPHLHLLLFCSSETKPSVLRESLTSIESGGYFFVFLFYRLSFLLQFFIYFLYFFRHILSLCSSILVWLCVVWLTRSAFWRTREAGGRAGLAAARSLPEPHACCCPCELAAR